jgi:cell division protein FtsX
MEKFIELLAFITVCVIKIMTFAICIPLAIWMVASQGLNQLTNSNNNNNNK